MMIVFHRRKIHFELHVDMHALRHAQTYNRHSQAPGPTRTLRSKYDPLRQKRELLRVEGFTVAASSYDDNSLVRYHQAKGMSCDRQHQGEDGAEFLLLVGLDGLPDQAVCEEVQELLLAPVLTLCCLHTQCLGNNVDGQHWLRRRHHAKTTSKI